MSIREGRENYLKPIITELNQANGDMKEGRVVEPDSARSAEGFGVHAEPFSMIAVDVADPSDRPKSPAPLIMIDQLEDQVPEGGDIDGKDSQRASKKPRKLAPEVIFVFDDMASQLKDPNVTQLLKTNRHYKSKVIISSQYLKDMLPEARRQIDYWIMFGGIPEEKLETIREDADLAVSQPEFSAIYHFATREKYNFLYIDATNGTFRRNFNTSIGVARKTP